MKKSFDSPVSLLSIFLCFFGLFFPFLDASNALQKRFHKALFARPPSLLVCISTWLTEQNAEPRVFFLAHIIENFKCNFSTDMNVHIHIDTNELQFLDSITRHLDANNGLAVNISLSVREWKSQEPPLNGDPFRLPVANRIFMQDEQNNFDFFMGIEDDILVPREAFDLYLSCEKEIWDFGYTFTWIRAEPGGKCQLDDIAIDYNSNLACRVFLSPSGKLWCHVPFSYAAMYVFNRDQLKTMVLDSSNVWLEGSPSGFEQRERIASGYNYALQPPGEWISRALLPLTNTNTLDDRALIWHMAKNYACLKTQLINKLYNVTNPPLIEDLPYFSTPTAISLHAAENKPLV